MLALCLTACRRHAGGNAYSLQSHQRTMPLHNIVAVLQYVGNITAPKTATFRQILPLMLLRAGMPGDTEIDIWEEVKFQDVLMINPIQQQCTLESEQISDGDILLLQERLTQVRTPPLGTPAVGNRSGETRTFNEIRARLHRSRITYEILSVLFSRQSSSSLPSDRQCLIAG